MEIFRNTFTFMIILVIAATLPVCSRAQNEKTNLLLITLDTTRADNMGSYGHMIASTPVMDRLAREGALFQNAWCSVPLTLPSHISIMTGLQPPSHGLPIIGIGVLPEKIPVLAELMNAAGYRTGAFLSSAVLGRLFGLNRGFNFYDDRWSGTDAKAGDHATRSANEVCGSALNWLKNEPSAPFMAWVHLYDLAGKPYLE